MNRALSYPQAFGGLDMFVAWKPTVAGRASFTSGLDTATRTVRVTGGGIWQQADVERYFIDQGRIVAEARHRFGKLKVFFDVREWVVENPQSALQFQDVNRQLYRPEDRLVAVVASSYQKPHPRTALCVGSPETFVSINAAETWLQAWS